MLVLSLTSIPPRFGTLGTTLASLLDQGADEIRLTLPYRYRRFANWDGTLPTLPKAVRLCRSDADFGPATKWLPVAQGLKGQAARLLICDDDFSYGPGWAAQFLDAAEKRPGAALTGSAFPVRRLGLECAPTAAKVAQGFSGILFSPDKLPAAAADPPGCAFGADDIWLSGMLALAGIDIVEVPGARALITPHSGEAAPLQRSRIGGMDRGAANRDTAVQLRARHGIWLV